MGSFIVYNETVLFWVNPVMKDMLVWNNGDFSWQDTCLPTPG